MNAKDSATTTGGAALGAGSALTAAAATICCAGPAIGPLLVATLGASGAVAVANLRPYTVWMLLGSALILAVSFWRTYRLSSACPPASQGRAIRLSRAILWVAAVTWIASTATTILMLLHS